MGQIQPPIEPHNHSVTKKALSGRTWLYFAAIGLIYKSIPYPTNSDFQLVLHRRQLLLREQGGRLLLRQTGHPPQLPLDLPSPDANQFIQLASSDDFLLSSECWKNVHPLLTTLPVDWDYTLPYGLIYSKIPSKELLQFLMAVGQMER